MLLSLVPDELEPDVGRMSEWSLDDGGGLLHTPSVIKVLRPQWYPVPSSLLAVGLSCQMLSSFHTRWLEHSQCDSLYFFHILHVKNFTRGVTTVLAAVYMCIVYATRFKKEVVLFRLIDFLHALNADILTIDMWKGVDSMSWMFLETLTQVCTCFPQRSLLRLHTPHLYSSHV